MVADGGDRGLGDRASRLRTRCARRSRRASRPGRPVTASTPRSIRRSYAHRSRDRHVAKSRREAGLFDPTAPVLERLAQTESTWLRQLKLAGLEEELFDRPAADFGWQQVTELRLINPDGTPGADLLPGFRYIQPIDQNTADRSLAAADLPVGIEPGQTVRLQVAWRAQVPRTFARTGAIGNYFFLAQWFPKLGVFEGDGWVGAAVLRQHRVLRRLRHLRRPLDRASRMGRRRHRPSGIANRHRRRHHRPPLRAGRRARLRLDDEPGLHRAGRAVRASDAAAGHHAAAAAAGTPRPGGSPFRRDGGRAQVLR